MSKGGNSKSYSGKFEVFRVQIIYHDILNRFIYPAGGNKL